MALFERGQTFFDKRAVNSQGSKPKYFIALNPAEFDDDSICCFVMNTEHRMDKHHLFCNKEVQKFILAPKTLSFISVYTSIMLNKVVLYKLEEVLDAGVELMDITNDTLLRQIKNCIDWGFIEPKFGKIIKDAFKDKPI